MTDKIVDYMKGDKTGQMPIMTNSGSIYQFGNNAYGKPATALNILRETIMGRELFDFAFKEYANRWKFKHPTPADLFRTLEDASGVDLDWFWRGWFYTTDHVDIAITDVNVFQVNTGNPDIEKPIAKQIKKTETTYIAQVRNEASIEHALVEKDAKANDFYNRFDPFAITVLDREEYEQYFDELTKEEKKLLASDKYYYEIHFENLGGLVMPLILQFEYADGTFELMNIPAEIWRMNDKQISKVFIKEKEVKSIILDPYLETADVETSNNHWPPKPKVTRFQLFKEKQEMPENPMQRQQRLEEKMNGER